MRILLITLVLVSGVGCNGVSNLDEILAELKKCEMVSGEKCYIAAIPESYGPTVKQYWVNKKTK